MQLGWKKQSYNIMYHLQGMESIVLLLLLIITLFSFWLFYRLQVLSNLIYDVLPPLLEYISRNGNAIAHHVQKSTDISIHIVYTFLALLSSVLDRNSPKQEEAQLKRTKMSIKHRAPSSVISTSRKGSFSSTTSTTVGPLEKTSFSMISHSSIVASDDQEQLIGEVDELGEVFELSNTQQHQMTTIFIFAIVWSFGGYVSLR